MEKLQRLEQDENGNMHTPDGKRIRREQRVGKIMTMVLRNPVLDADEEAYDIIGMQPKLRGANAYVVSPFNPDAQFIRQETSYSCYAIQFYRI